MAQALPSRSCACFLGAEALVLLRLEVGVEGIDVHGGSCIQDRGSE